MAALPEEEEERAAVGVEGAHETALGNSSKDHVTLPVMPEGEPVDQVDSNRFGRKLNFQKNSLTLACSNAPSYAESLETPDSDGDILGVLDHSPDACDQFPSSGHMFTPYSRVFEPLRFMELMANVYIRNQAVTLEVVDMEIMPSTLGLFNQCMFTIDLHHGSTHWTITRKSRQISSLHNQLRLFKTKLKLPAATSGERERRQSMRVQMKSIRSVGGTEGNVAGPRRLVKFPRKALQRMDKATAADVELYLSNLLQHSLLRSHCHVVEFFEISPISFVGNLGPKLKEGFVKKRVGSRVDIVCCGGRYKRRWLVVRETCIFCLSPGGGNIRTVMLFDSGFQVSHGFLQTRIANGLLVTNLSRSLVLKCDVEESSKDFKVAIEYALKKYASDFFLPNRHLSYAPVRKASYARWYVDGSWYMNDVADLLELAQEEIFITDWWLSPDIYLKRPDLTGKQWKLNEILKRQAARGVKVFILLYKEVELAIGLNSLYTKQNLCQLSSNIHVLRHPDHYKGSLYWAHHEKMVIVDQMHAFIGGIDLCYGRWDDYRHKLVDVGHAGRVVQKTQDTSLGKLIINTHDLFTKGVSSFPRKESFSPKSLERDAADGEKVEILLESAVESNDVKHTHLEVPSLIKNRVVLNDYKISDSSLHTSNSSESDTKEIDCDINLNDSSKHSINSVVKIEVNGMATNHEHLGLSHVEICATTSEFSDISSDSSNSENVPSPTSDVDAKVIDNDDAEKEDVGDTMEKADQLKTHRKITRNFQAMKSLGIDLVGEMKEKRKEMKQWTEKKVPRLKRTGSYDSEIVMTSSSEEEEGDKKRPSTRSKRFGRKLKRRLKARGKTLKDTKLGVTGSLIDLHKELAHGEVTSVHLWIGKDYVNWITKDLYDPHIPFIDNVNRHETPRMPWHDIALYVEGPAARDAARHFIQRWNAVKSEKTKNNDRYVYLIPKTYKPSSFTPSILQLKHRVKCQVVRSLGKWNGGINETERSIYNALLDAIKNAKHFIYIENQFFISSASVSKSEVSNSIAYRLFERIVDAFRTGQTFRVYIVLPLLPAFEGQIGTPSGIAMQYILHYTYQSIIRGPNSLIGMLEAERIHWQRYISFCSLRTHDMLEGHLVSELIYVHSKLLIVDDRLVIAGSANINDRSLLGDRDSEVDLVIEDEEFTKGVMNGREYRRGQFAGSLRMYLFTEHLGVEGSGIDVSDPVSDSFFMRTWQGTASKNTKIYDDVFSCIPCDAATTFAELKRLRGEISMAKKFPERAKERLKDIQGRLVLYPLRFLKDEFLKPGPTHKEFLLPNDMWL